MKAIPHPRATTLLLAIDLVGTGLFAAEGASVALNARLDLLGVLVTATGGGILRDVLLGDTPPSSIRDWRYFFTALIAGAGVFLVHSAIHFENLSLITLLDAAGLSFFAVAGAAKAVQFGIHPLLCVVMGGITGVGGGAVRDVLLDRVPMSQVEIPSCDRKRCGDCLLLCAAHAGSPLPLEFAGRCCCEFCMKSSPPFFVSLAGGP
jgi:uncharacterized membrane protein YeiH